MAIIECKELKGSLFYDNEIMLNYSIKYPCITTDVNKAKVAILNDLFKVLSLEVLGYMTSNMLPNAIELYNLSLKDKYTFHPLEVAQNYEVTFNRCNVISMYFDTYRYEGGAHGSTIRKSLNFDISSLRVIDICNVLEFRKKTCASEVAQEVINQINNSDDKKLLYFEKYDTLVKEKLDLKNYYFDNKNVTIFFQQYDIAPYSSGIVTFDIN